MILPDSIDRPYENIPIRTLVEYKCDYCGCLFKRIKKSRERLNKHVDKDSCGIGQCKKQKAMDVNQKLYGCDYAFKSEKIKIKIKQTNTSKYGSENYFSSKNFQEKRTAALIERYGVDSPLKNKNIQNAQKATMKLRHGVENASHSKKFLDKMKKQNLERYGVSSFMQLPENRLEVSNRFKGAKHHNWIEDRDAKFENDKFRAKTRTLLKNSLKYLNCKKNNKTFSMLGYTSNDLKIHLESHPNYANVKDKKWHIDHIFPVQAFLDFNIKDISLVNCLENLQPLEQFDNLSKHAYYDQKEFIKWLKTKGIDF